MGYVLGQRGRQIKVRSERGAFLGSSARPAATMKKIFECDRWRTGSDWGLWFRIFGRGLAVSTMLPTFSQRHGYTAMLRIGRVKIVPL
jgi:hypothetical protein